MKVGESTGTGSCGARTAAAAVGGRQVHIKEDESTCTGRGGRLGDGVGNRQVYRKRRRQDGGGEAG